MANLPQSGRPLSTYQESEGYTELPEGKYSVVFEESTVEPTENQKGIMAKFKGIVLEGPYKGKKFFDNLMWQHENEDAENIGRGRLKSLCIACGINPDTLKATQVLHNIPVIAVRQKSKKGEMNTVKYIDRQKAIQDGDFVPDSGLIGTRQNNPQSAEHEYNNEPPQRRQSQGYR